MYLFQLFDVVYREETLLNVIRSVTRNGRSIILTAVLALILVYMFSIIGYMFFKDDFIVSVKKKNGRKSVVLEKSILIWFIFQTTLANRFPTRLAINTWKMRLESTAS